MGFAFLDRYDVQACAEQCNQRGADSQGGECQFFNIWRALVNGVPTTYTCSMVIIIPFSFPSGLTSVCSTLFRPTLRPQTIMVRGACLSPNRVATNASTQSSMVGLRISSNATTSASPIPTALGSVQAPQVALMMLLFSSSHRSRTTETLSRSLGLRKPMTPSRERSHQPSPSSLYPTGSTLLDFSSRVRSARQRKKQPRS